MSDEEGVFSRWSRRKRAVAEEEAASLPVPEAEPSPGPIAEPETPEEEAALLEKLGLPVPESLTDGDDFSAFMAKGVPEFLRKRALRVLWRSNPVLANLDGLNDYDEDFNSPELTQKVLATGYQVGKGFARRVVEVIEGDEPQPEDEPVAALVEEEGAGNDSSDLDEPTSVLPREEPDEEVQPKPRRMRFET